ncbi:MAG TPA: diacylglycerol kinase family protein [Thermodesulfovibrionales bacterium]|nr:diacylglycerol kinase family protein [Thermodesulfovibrionales bacterium]
MKSSIILICNPTAKKASGRKIAKASHSLESRGYAVEVLFTERKRHAENLAREAVKRFPSLIIAAGGDGTFNEVINGIAGSEVPMAILPLGTTNVLAKELGIPEDIERALEIALQNTPKTISLGKISGICGNQLTCHPSLVTRYFVLMAGIGFDGEAVLGVNETLKKFSGKGAYIYSGIRTLFRFRPSELFFHIDGVTISGYTAIIGKAAKYGGNYRISPDARLSDPFFYVCLFKGKNRSDILRYVFGIVTNRHLKFRDVEYRKATTIEVKGNAHIQIDGDYFGKTPVKVEVVPNIVRLIF